MNNPKIMRSVTRLISDIVDTTCYVLWYSHEDDGWIAITSNWPGLSGIAKTPSEALMELRIAVRLAADVAKDDQHIDLLCKAD